MSFGKYAGFIIKNNELQIDTELISMYLMTTGIDPATGWPLTKEQRLKEANEIHQYLIESITEVINYSLRTHWGLAIWTWYLLQRLATKDPEKIHYDIAQWAIEDFGKKSKSRSALTRRALAHALCDHGRKLFNRFLDHFENEKWIPEIEKPSEKFILNKIFTFDAILENHLKSYGKTGKEKAEEVRESSTSRCGRSSDPEIIWKLWMNVKDHKSLSLKSYFLEFYSEFLWKKVAKPEVNSSPYKFLSVQPAKEDDHYCKVLKLSALLGWGLGGTGTVADSKPAVNINIDGDIYQKAPKIVRYVSKAVGVMPRSFRAGQNVLPVELHESTSVALKAAGSQKYILDPYAGKMFLFMLTTCPNSGMVRGSVDELTKVLNPQKKRIQARDRLATVQAARNLREVWMIMSDNTDIQVFDIRAPSLLGKINKKQPICWSFSNQLKQAIENEEFKFLKGEFILNLSGAMRLSGNEAPALRQYIFACASWNDAKNPASKRFDPKYLPTYTIEEWAAATNSLNSGSVDCIENEESKIRYKLSRDRKKTWQHLKILSEKYGLIRIEKTSKKKFKILPPNSLLEAYNQHRKGYRRPRFD